MKSHEIVTHVAGKLGVHPAHLHQTIDKHMNDGMKDVQHGDTIMFYKLLNHNSCFVHFVTADSPLNLVSSLTYFDHMLKENGIHNIYLNTKSKTLRTALSSAGIHLTPSDNPSYKLMGILV